MTPDEKEEVLERLVSLNQAVQSISEFADQAAGIAKGHDASALAFSLFMLKDAIVAYGIEVNKWAKEYISS
jgi:hypothetical protein